MKILKIKVEDLGKKSVHTYCRKLLAEGEDSDSRLEVYRHEDRWDFAVSNIGEGAKWALKEEPRLHLERYRGPPDFK